MAHPPIESFGEWVRERRKRNSLTQKALGSLIGYAEITVRQVESDSYALTRFIVERLLDALADESDDRGAILRFALRATVSDADDVKLTANLSAATPFLGRQDELTRLDALLKDPTCHLITIIGFGGVGKTRLALRALEQHRADHAQTWAIPLSSLRKGDLLLKHLAETLSIPINPFGPTDPQVLQALHGKKGLLLLDNFEQILPDGAAIIQSILEHAPSLKLIITSRERLRLSSEWTFRLDGLRTNHDDLPSQAAELFIQTARRLQYDFAPSSDETETIEAICQAVQGLPLAIEMAASWTELYSCSEILKQISLQMTALSGRQRDLIERHQTMTGVLESTWAHLTPSEQNILARLTCFRGGFTRDAAQSITSATPEELAHLQDKMLVQPLVSDRLALHEIIRAFAAQKLAEDREKALDAQMRHAAYFVEWQKESVNRFDYSHTREEVERFITEVDNLEAMWTAICSTRQVDWFWRTWKSLLRFNNILSRFAEGEAMFEASVSAFNIADASSDLQRVSAFSKILSAMNLIPQGRIAQSRDYVFSPEVMRLRTSESDLDRYQVNNVQSIVHLLFGEIDASLACALEAKNAAEALQDPGELATSHLLIGRAQFLGGNKESALTMITEALRLVKEHGADWFLGLLLTELAAVTEANLRLQSAEELYEAALAHTLQHNFQLWNYPRILISLGRVKLALGNLAQAIAQQTAALEVMNEYPSLGFQLECFTEIALILNVVNDPTTAIAILEYATHHPESIEPARTLGIHYLTMLRAQHPNIDAEITRHLLPSDKQALALHLHRELAQIALSLSSPASPDRPS